MSLKDEIKELEDKIEEFLKKQEKMYKVLQETLLNKEIQEA